MEFNSGFKNGMLRFKTALVTIPLAILTGIVLLFLSTFFPENLVFLLLRGTLALISSFFISKLGVNFFVKRYVVMRTGFGENTEKFFLFRRIFGVVSTPTIIVFLTAFFLELLKYFYIVVSIVIVIMALVAIYFYKKTKQKFLEDYSKA
jgi:hypothetical protein